MINFKAFLTATLVHSIISIFLYIHVHLQNKKQLLRLCCGTLHQKSYLQSLLEAPDVASLLIDPVISGDQQLAWVLLYEFVVGHKVLRASRSISSAVGRHSKAIRDQMTRLELIGCHPLDKSAISSNSIPRYARVNTLLTDFDTVIVHLVAEGYQIDDFRKITMSRRRYREVLLNLQANQVILDKDVQDLLVFAIGTDLHSHWLICEGHVILQDKASCLSALNLQLGDDNCQVMDICAAPGIKTSHLAALMRNKGKIWSIDRASDRVETMKKLLSRNGVAISSVFCGDFLRTDVSDKRFRKVEFAVIDPPCSGSGIVKRMDEITDDNTKFDTERLNSLGNLQAMLLKHALEMPSLKRLVYSTCSIYERENELVVNEALEANPDFKLIKASSQWKHRGRKGYDFSSFCLRASPKKDLTNGFFVAVFERK